ncbi:MAG TPA: TIM barrel protein [bacterium]|nr:TIM barrel protein [bacterium]HPN44707.1 TIM barrel protein [bacterium]
MAKQHVLIGVTLDKFNGFTPSMLISGLDILGMKFVEVTITVLGELETFPRKLGRMQTAFHLPLVHETGWDLSCLEHADKIAQLIADLNKHHALLKIHHLVCHPPECIHLGNSLPAAQEFLFANLKKLDIPVYLENIPEYTPQEFTQFYHQARQELGAKIAGICYDAAHYYITGIDPVTQYTELASEIGCIHLSDCEEKKDAHLPFGLGQLPVKDILKAIQKSRYKGYVTLEILPHSMQDLDAYIRSYLTTLYYLDYKKYLLTRMRLFFLRPLINKFIK